MDWLIRATVSLATLLFIPIIVVPHIAYSEELAPGYNSCMKNINISVSNSEIRKQEAVCLEKAENYWEKRLSSVLKKAQKLSEKYKNDSDRIKEDIKKYQNAFKEYKEATNDLMPVYASGGDVLHEELNIRTLRVFVIELEKFYK